MVPGPDGRDGGNRPPQGGPVPGDVRAGFMTFGFDYEGGADDDESRGTISKWTQSALCDIGSMPIPCSLACSDTGGWEATMLINGRNIIPDADDGVPVRRQAPALRSPRRGV